MTTQSHFSNSGLVSRGLILAILISLLMAVPAANAAFILRSKKAVVQRQAQPPLAESHFSIKKFRQYLRARPYQEEVGAGFGIASLGTAIAGLLCLVLFSSTAGSLALLVATLVLAISAVVFGAMGLRREMKGLAIAGMIMGIVEIVAICLGIVFVAIALASC